MSDTPPGSSYAPPSDRDARLIRGAALVLFAVVTWADAVTPMGIAVPALYVAPILLFAGGGRPWEPLAAAAAAA